MACEQLVLGSVENMVQRGKGIDTADEGEFLR